MTPDDHWRIVRRGLYAEATARPPVPSGGTCERLLRVYCEACGIPHKGVPALALRRSIGERPPDLKLSIVGRMFYGRTPNPLPSFLKDEA